MNVISTEADLTRAISELIGLEPRFRAVLERHGPPPLRLAAPGLHSLLRIVTDQLISLQAGAAIWQRVEARFDPVSADIIRSSSVSELQALGLSGAKARCFLAAAGAQLDFDLLHRQSDEQITAELTRISGIGPWTADIYLLTAAGRSDAWPTGDLALQIAAADLFNLPGRPDLKSMTALAAPWRPYRSTAARLLWSHYRFLKGMPQQVI
jgi:DNA-3-methyladenine glycosylase II